MKGVKVTIKWHPKPFEADLDKKIDRKLNIASKEYREFVKNSFGLPGKPNIVTGKLKSSIDSGKVRKNKYRIGTNVIYAKFLEYGTSRISKLPFFRPALTTFMLRLKAIFSNPF